MAYDRDELFKLRNSTGTRINGCKLDGRKFGSVGKGFIVSTPWFSNHLKKGNTRTKQKKFQGRACQQKSRCGTFHIRGPHSVTLTVLCYYQVNMWKHSRN